MLLLVGVPRMMLAFRQVTTTLDISLLMLLPVPLVETEQA